MIAPARQKADEFFRILRKIQAIPDEDPRVTYDPRDDPSSRAAGPPDHQRAWAERPVESRPSSRLGNA